MNLRWPRWHLLQEDACARLLGVVARVATRFRGAAAARRIFEIVAGKKDGEEPGVEVANDLFCALTRVAAPGAAARAMLRWAHATDGELTTGVLDV